MPLAGVSAISVVLGAFFVAIGLYGLATLAGLVRDPRNPSVLEAWQERIGFPALILLGLGQILGARVLQTVALLGFLVVAALMFTRHRRGENVFAVFGWRRP